MRRPDHCGRQPHRAVPAGRVQEVLEGLRWGSAGLIPVGGSLVQRDYDAGFGAAKLAQQELPEQGVVAVPLPLAVERDQEHAGGLQAAQLPGRVAGPEDGIAQRAAELVEHGRAAQEPLHVLRLLAQGLAVQVVGNIPVVTGDGRCLAAALLGDHRGQVEAGRPALGPFGHRGSQLRRQADLCVGKNLLGAGRIEGQVARPELQCLARGPQSRQVGLLATTGGGQLGSLRNRWDHHAEHVMAGR